MKNYLVTGAAKGLGLAITHELLSDPNNAVYGLNRGNSPEYEALMKTHAGRCFFQSYDLQNIDDMRKTIFVDFLQKNSIHGFVNNAALAYDDIITNLRLDPLEAMFRVNVFAPMMLTKLAIRNMLLHKVKGSIVHISSISVHTGYKGLSMYAASKGALEAFSKNTAREWGSTGVRSNALVAGFMETEMSATLDADQKSRIYARTSLKKPTEKQSVAATVSFLLSENARSITGQVIHVDSGTI